MKNPRTEQEWREQEQARAMAAVGDDLARAHQKLEAISLEVVAVCNILDRISWTVCKGPTYTTDHANAVQQKVSALMAEVGAILRVHQDGEDWWTRQGVRR